VGGLVLGALGHLGASRWLLLQLIVSLSAVGGFADQRLFSKTPPQCVFVRCHFSKSIFVSSFRCSFSGFPFHGSLRLRDQDSKPEDSDSFRCDLHIRQVVICWSWRHVLSTAGPCRPYGAASERAGRLRAGDVFSSARRGPCEGQAFLKSYPKAAYMSEVERWRELPGGAIEFTMRRLRTAD
jgi:hypothetical protein